MKQELLEWIDAHMHDDETTICELIKEKDQNVKENDVVNIKISNIEYDINNEDLEDNGVETKEELIAMLPEEVTINVIYTDDCEEMMERVNEAIEEETGMLTWTYQIQVEDIIAIEE